MKFNQNKSFFSKFVFFINIIIGFLVGVCYFFNNFYSDFVSDYAIISVFFPIIFIINFLFFIYWLIRFDLRLIYSLFFIVLFANKPVFIINSENKEESKDSFHLMSYNVRLFNHYQWLKTDSIPEKISDYIKINQPDILTLQEYHNDYEELFNHYPEKYFGLNGENVGLAIFSKKELLNKGTLEDENGRLLAIYVDFIEKEDTLRVYNLHLKSYNLDILKLKADKKSLKEILNKTRNAYKIQNNEIDLFIKHVKTSPYQNLISVDLNNTPYTYVYKKINKNFKDSFVEKGGGFGSTYGFGLIPIRIDYLFVSSSIYVDYFKTHDINLSDHKPISVYLNI